MYRVERSPDRPMLIRRRDRHSVRAPEAVICAGDTIPEGVLLYLIPTRRAMLEPDPARAIALCLQGGPSRLLIDVASLDEAALSALVHLRLLRPDLALVILVGDEEPDRLEGTAFHDTPMLQVPRMLPPQRFAAGRALRETSDA